MGWFIDLTRYTAT